jgi:5-methylcytosine-specific restriction endonuclease McrA
VFGYLYRAASSILRERKKAKTRSPKWATVRDHFLEGYPTCAACGSKRLLQVHHVEPYHLDPERELDLTNLIGLCMSRHECHLRLGHGGFFEAFNPIVRTHAATALTHPEQRKHVELMARVMRRT